MKVAIFVACVIATAFAAPSSNNSWRIIGGKDARQGQFPHQVSVRNKGRHSCGGSILDATTILCAAHCIDGAITSTMTVTVGNPKLSAQTEEYKVKSYVGHEDYNPFQIKNDIAIIKLSTAIEFSDNVQPIALRQTNVGEEEVILSGWGVTSYPVSTSPDDLQYVHLKTISVEECQERHSKSVADTEVCTLAESGEGACHGDSGGPLIDLNGEQIGIVSWGIPCAGGHPDVFTRVYSFLDWIKRNRH